jgi:thioredoxin reductase/SAM-dependent methyltransferase
MNEQWDAIVIGAGPAGLSAALMLGRARRRTLVIDAGNPRNRFAAHLHGVLGNEGTPPGQFLERGRIEISGYGVAFREGVVDQVADSQDGLTITLGTGEVVQTRSIVVASGMTDELPEITGLARFWGRSVLHCPYCHGWEVRDQRLGVLVTSPVGLHVAQLVRQWSDRVTILASEEPEPEVGQRLRSRGVQIVTDPVVEVLGDDDHLTGIRTASGHRLELDAIFVSSAPGVQDGLLAGLQLNRIPNPFGTGTLLAVDASGKTSHPRVWAAGNVVNPSANVPMSMAAGAMAGAAVNATLLEEDFDRAFAAASPLERATTPADWWEARYAGTEHAWSGRVNKVLADVAAGLTPGRALDLGCGEGGDVVWLAQRGWTVTGIDLSRTATERGRAAAAAAGISPDSARFEAADLATWTTPERYDLVTISFLHSWPVPIPRNEILRHATEFVAPGGHLLVTAHVGAPSWSGDHELVHSYRFPTPASDLDALALETGRWDVLVCETRQREVAAPDGSPATIDDGVLLVRRLAGPPRDDA